MRVFITGISGFAGVHLAAHLLAGGHEVRGSVSRRREVPGLATLAARHAGFDPARLACVDLGDRAGLARALAEDAPERVFHLAGIAFVPRAGADIARTFAVNVLGTVHLLEAVQEAAPAARVLVVGSSDAYGAIAPEELPIGEDVPLRPVSVYGISKAAADMAAFQRWWASGLAVIRVRSFNHTGPGQSPDFVCADFARQLARIEAGMAPPVLRVGNLGAARDFSDVRDIVHGYALLMERGEPGAAYNLCSGAATTVGTIVEQLTAECRVRVEVIADTSRVRTREVPVIVGSAARAAALGWAPAIPLRQTLRDLLAHWRRALAS